MMGRRTEKVKARGWRRFGLLAVVAGLPLLVAVAYVLLIPVPADPVLAAPAESTRILDRHGRLLAAITPGGYHHSVDLGDVPPALVQATLAAEDASFYRNPGVDAGAIVRALFLDVKGSGRQLYGGSTVTQQLVRNLYLSPAERRSTSLWRKIHEAALAIKLTRMLPKQRILALYLNNVYYGNLAYGVDAAAEVYFGRPVRTLDMAECAMLAGLPRSPALYDPLRHPAAAARRQRDVLRLMAAHGLITPSQEQAAAAEPLTYTNGMRRGEAPHFVTYVLDLLEERWGAQRVRQGGLVVTTTLDLDVQHLAERAVARHVTALASHNVHDAAAVVLDPRSGEILAYVGSADPRNRAISGAVDVALSPRQPGSAIKPFTYAAAFQDGLSPATVLADVPMSFPTREGDSYTPQNYDLQFHGPVPLRVALASSLNVPSVALLQRVGLSHMLAVAHALGITTLNDAERYGLALTLGGGEVRLLDLTAAYGVFAAAGVRHPPLALLAVAEARGRTLLTRPVLPGGQVLGPHGAQVAYLITDVLSDPYARLLGFGEGGPLELPGRTEHFGAAVKTGTTGDWRDNWTIGYTPEVVAGVWVGNADDSPMEGVSGVTGAAPIWHDIMDGVLRGHPATPFERPSGLRSMTVCTDSGTLPGALCPHRAVETFIAGYEPRQRDTTWRLVRVDTASGQAATATTPASRSAWRLFHVFPPEAREWARAQGYPDPPAPRPGSRLAAPTAGSARALTSPLPGAVYQISTSLPRTDQRLAVAAQALDATASRVVLSVDGHTLATFASPPYAADWVLQPGQHEVAVTAWDARGRRAWGGKVRITVLNPAS